MRDCFHHGERTWFDRTLCSEPCESMHDVCEACGKPVGVCPLWDYDETRPRGRGLPQKEPTCYPNCDGDCAAPRCQPPQKAAP